MYLFCLFEWRKGPTEAKVPMSHRSHMWSWFCDPPGFHLSHVHSSRPSLCLPSGALGAVPTSSASWEPTHEQFLTTALSRSAHLASHTPTRWQKHVGLVLKVRSCGRGPDPFHDTKALFAFFALLSCGAFQSLCDPMTSLP